MDLGRKYHGVATTISGGLQDFSQVIDGSIGSTYAANSRHPAKDSDQTKELVSRFPKVFRRPCWGQLAYTGQKTMTAIPIQKA